MAQDEPDDPRRKQDYRTARAVSAGVLIGVAAFIVVIDSLGIGREVQPLILYGLLAVAAGMLAIDVKLPWSGK